MTPGSRFHGQVALVTGGNDGLGLAAARRFARDGARVVLAARRKEQGADAVALIEADGGEAAFIQTDVTDPQALLFVLNKMGQPLYGSQPPTGYSTRSDVWVNSAALLDRMNFGLALATNKLPGTSFSLAQLMNATPAPAASATAVDAGTLTTAALGNDDPYQVQLKLEQLLLAGDISKQTHDAIEQQIVGPQMQGENMRNQPNVNVIAGLLLGSPEFQRK